MKNDLAVIIPVYNEGPIIRDNLIKIMRVLTGDGLSCSFMLVDDGSSDNTWSELVSLSREYENVSSIRFARNFGKEIAISAGLDNIDAQLYLIMDSDLQHPPRFVKEMLALMEKEQANIVDGVKVNRGKEPRCYKLVARCFYRALKFFTGFELNNSSDFKLIDRQVVDALRQFKESSLFFRGLVAWVGFKKVTCEFVVDQRTGAGSRFSTGKLMLLAINSLVSHTSKPLYLTIFSGLLFLLISIGLGIQTLYNYFSGVAVSGFSTVIILLLFTGSMVMISLGVIGIYIARIYDEVKKRPRYIVSERTGHTDVNTC